MLCPRQTSALLFWNLKEQWPYLTNYLNDGRLEISNNRAERSIKPFVIDRKNFLFANTPKGAAGSAVMFSLIQTAIENNLDPYKYLTWLLKQAKDTDLTDKQTIQALLPWNTSSASDRSSLISFSFAFWCMSKASSSCKLTMYSRAVVLVSSVYQLDLYPLPVSATNSDTCTDPVRSQWLSESG